MFVQRHIDIYIFGNLMKDERVHCMQLHYGVN